MQGAHLILFNVGLEESAEVVPFAVADQLCSFRGNGSHLCIEVCPLTQQGGGTCLQRRPSLFPGDAAVTARIAAGASKLRRCPGSEDGEMPRNTKRRPCEADL